MSLCCRFWLSGLLWLVLAGCQHQASDVDWEAVIEAEELKQSPFSSFNNYSAVLSRLDISESKKTLLRELQTELSENTFSLTLRGQKLSKVLTRELMQPDYSRERVAQVMALVVKNSREMTRLRLEAMLKARDIISLGLGPEQLKRAASSSSAVFMLR